MKTLFSSVLFFSSLILSQSSFAERPSSLENEVEAITINSEVQHSNDSPMAHDTDTQMEMDAEHTRMNHQSQQPTKSANLTIPNTQAASIKVNQLNFPRRGMLQDRVQNELGRPIEIIPAVGMPPISRWVYNDRTVYFEFDSVIHVVEK